MCVCVRACACARVYVCTLSLSYSNKPQLRIRATEKSMLYLLRKSTDLR